MELLNCQIVKLLNKAGVQSDIRLTVPPKAEMGDLAFACFDIAKKEGKNPVEVARELVEKCRLQIADCKIIERIEPIGPYINFYLRTCELANLLLNEISRKDFGKNNVGAEKKVLVEYPSNNTHKELHIGHLRNICIGNALTHLFNASGYKAIPINYINDFGSHVPKCLWYIQKFKQSEICNLKSAIGRQKWLGEMYAEASQYLEAHLDEKQEVYNFQIKLEAHDRSVWGLFKKTRKWSLAGFEKIFEELGVVHKKTFYEKDVKEIGQKTVDELLKKGIAQVGEGGAIIVDLNKYNLDTGLLRKSNGVGLYLTSDFGLAVAKNKKYPDIAESIHITGAEQVFYFKQLFKILELAGYHYKMTHIPYGLVTRPEGKMSSRLGNVILYDDLRDDVYEKVLEEVKSRHQDWSERQIVNTAKIIALGAIKFEFLKHEAIKNIVFDAKAATSFDGFTGPYVLYVVARINSIIRKSKIKNQKSKFLDKLITDEEKKLVMMTGEYSEIIKKALGSYNPSVITKYCFDLAQAFNDFYTKHSVLNAESKELILARLALCGAVRKVLVDALRLLTIETVEEM